MDSDMKKSVEFRVNAVQTYLQSYSSLRVVSKQLGIHYNTLLRWVKLFRAGGKENLKDRESNFLPWNRICKEDEEVIVALKESNPGLTIMKAKTILERRRKFYSAKGIWGVWRRYGYTGFDKTRLSSDYLKGVHISRNEQRKIEYAKNAVLARKYRKASDIVNCLLCCPDRQLLGEIPERYLNERRKLDKLSALFGEIPYTQFRKKIMVLRKSLIAAGHQYSAIRAGVKEVLVLEWLGKPKEKLRLIKELRHLLGRKRSYVLTPILFTLSASEFIANMRLLRINTAVENLLRCKQLSKRLSSPVFLNDLAILYSYLGYYREMGKLLTRVIEMTEYKEGGPHIVNSLAFVKSSAGDYRSSLSLLGSSKKALDSIGLFAKSHSYIGVGKIEKARELAKQGLMEAKKMGIMAYVSNGTMILAEVNAALRERKRAMALVTKYVGLLRELGMYGSVISREIILRKTHISEQAKKVRTIKLACLVRDMSVSLKVGDYKKALQFAIRFHLLGVFHRLVLFFPETVLLMIEKGKDTGLPRTVLNLPVFKKEVPVYYIKFLGNVIVFKNQKYLRTNMSPKDVSFLIYVALSQVKRIPLEKIYENFWKSSKNPPRNLSHLLVRLRKSLRLPSNYLYVKEGKLSYECYFTTDYHEYLEHLAQAKALMRAGKWRLAKNEFQSAFSLFSGAPFKKMYDNWSDDKRLEILFSFEKEIRSFAKELMARERKEEAEKLLKKAERIVPDLDESLRHSIIES